MRAEVGGDASVATSDRGGEVCALVHPRFPSSGPGNGFPTVVGSGLFAKF